MLKSFSLLQMVAKMDGLMPIGSNTKNAACRYALITCEEVKTYKTSLNKKTRSFPNASSMWAQNQDAGLDHS